MFSLKSKFSFGMLSLILLGFSLGFADDVVTNAAPSTPLQVDAASVTNAPVQLQIDPTNPAPTEPATPVESPANAGPPSTDKAVAQFHAGQLDEAIDTMNAVLQADPKNLNGYILRGAIYTQKQSWDLAQKDYQTALQMDTTNDGVRYDLAELKFLQKQFDDARAALVPLQNNKDDEVSDLIKYKIYICDLFAGHDDLAATELKDFDQAGAKASYYFGNAAWALVHQKPEDARSWLRSGASIYPPRKQSLYLILFKEMGYLPLPPDPNVH